MSESRTPFEKLMFKDPIQRDFLFLTFSIAVLVTFGFLLNGYISVEGTLEKIFNVFLGFIMIVLLVYFLFIPILLIRKIVDTNRANNRISRGDKDLSTLSNAEAFQADSFNVFQVSEERQSSKLTRQSKINIGIAVTILMGVITAPLMNSLFSTLYQKVQNQFSAIDPNKITFLESTLKFECVDKNEIFYTVIFGVSFKNDTNLRVTNENIKSVQFKAGLLNINGMGREETSYVLVVPRNGIEPGRIGQLAFSLNSPLGMQWKSLDINVNQKRVYDQAIEMSDKRCPT